MSNLKKILKNKKTCKSIWFMRQAGRYLPEFREIRKNNPDFIKLCMNSELSSEITLQPIKRFNLDSAIIFSDILIVPYALGQNLKFYKDLGPQLEKFNEKNFLNANVNDFIKKLDPVYKAINTTRKKLQKEKSLISFVGAPWTLLIYMLNLRNNKNRFSIEKLKEMKKIEEIIQKLIHYLCIHIKNQNNAGADVVQIFDSWAGLIPEESIKKYCFDPNKLLVNFCKKNEIPNICFPKGIGNKYLEFNILVKPDGLNLDSQIEPSWAKENLKNVVLQGGLDPSVLLKKENEMIEAATKYTECFKDTSYVFNLGHGLLPETDPDKVKKLINFYRNYE